MNILLDLTIRSSVVLAIALATSIMLRRRSAALRHWVLALGVFSAVAVLPLSVMLPGWDLPIPATASTAVLPAVPELTSIAALADESLPVIPRSANTWPWLLTIWTTGFLVTGTMLLGGYLRLRHLAARAELLREGDWPRLVEKVTAIYGMKRRVALLKTNAPDMLATFGFVRPQVLLPAHSSNWSEEQIFIGLSHELAHIRRNDWFVQISAEVMRAVYWFNPLLWIVCTRLRQESEQACDDVVLEIGVPAQQYATTLLDLARRCRPPRPSLAGAMPMARPSTLERRIAAMLNANLNRHTVTRRAGLLTAVLLLTITLPTSALRGLAAAQSEPLTVSGSVYDTTGAVLPQVTLTLEAPEQFKWEAVTDASGRFEFAPAGPGRYVLQASLPGFRPLRQVLDLRRARDWNRAITLQVGDLEETVTVVASRAPAARPQSAADNAPLRIGGNIRQPYRIHNVAPVYPPAMREAGLEGVVPMEAVIGRDGAVISVRVLSAQVHPDFAASAVEAVRQWRFGPTLLNGEAVEVVMTVSVRFNLAD